MGDRNINFLFYFCIADWARNLQKDLLVIMVEISDKIVINTGSTSQSKLVLLKLSFYEHLIKLNHNFIGYKMIKLRRCHIKRHFTTLFVYEMALR